MSCMQARQSIRKVEQMLATARRLRAARAACRKFLMLWVMQKSAAASRHENELSDHVNHDWSLLYLGSVLDD
jgi:hypothetical protein